MMATKKLVELGKPVTDGAWDDVFADASKVPVPDWHRSILDERLTEYQAASDEGEAWPRVRDRLLRDLAERKLRRG
jgi:hypothetical protein